MPPVSILTARHSERIGEIEGLLEMLADDGDCHDHTECVDTLDTVAADHGVFPVVAFCDSLSVPGVFLLIVLNSGLDRPCESAGVTP